MEDQQESLKEMPNIESMVRDLLEKNGVKSAPVPVERIAESLGARLVYEPSHEGEEEVYGMLYRDEGQPVIGVNSTNHIHRQRFTIAHEIGHLLCHEGKMYVDSPIIRYRDSKSGLAIDKEEIEANGFAAELLIPKNLLNKSLKTIDRKKMTDPKKIIEHLSKEYKVSAQTVEFRLKNLGILFPE